MENKLSKHFFQISIERRWPNPIFEEKNAGASLRCFLFSFFREIVGRHRSVKKSPRRRRRRNGEGREGYLRSIIGEGGGKRVIVIPLLLLLLGGEITFSLLSPHHFEPHKTRKENIRRNAILAVEENFSFSLLPLEEIFFSRAINKTFSAAAAAAETRREGR